MIHWHNGLPHHARLRKGFRITPLSFFLNSSNPQPARMAITDNVVRRSGTFFTLYYLVARPVDCRMGVEGRALIAIDGSGQFAICSNTRDGRWMQETAFLTWVERVVGWADFFVGVLLFFQIFSVNFMLEGEKAFHFLNICIFAFQQIFLDINEKFLGKWDVYYVDAGAYCSLTLCARLAESRFKFMRCGLGMHK